MSDTLYFHRNPPSGSEFRFVLGGFSGLPVEDLLPTQPPGLRLIMPGLSIPEAITILPLSELPHALYVDPAKVKGNYDEAVNAFEQFNRRPYCNSVERWGFYPLSISVIDRNRTVLTDPRRVTENNIDIRYSTHTQGMFDSMKAYLFSLEYIQTYGRFFPTYLSLEDPNWRETQTVIHIARFKSHGEMPNFVLAPDLDTTKLLMLSHLNPWIQCNPGLQESTQYIIDQEPWNDRGFGYIINRYEIPRL